MRTGVVEGRDEEYSKTSELDFFDYCEIHDSEVMRNRHLSCPSFILLFLGPQSWSSKRLNC